MSISTPDIVPSAFKVGQTPWLLGAVSAADALVGLLGLDRAELVGDRRVQGDRRRPGGLPHQFSRIPSFGKAQWHGGRVHAPRQDGRLFHDQP
jgi:hypothetical protein